MSDFSTYSQHHPKPPNWLKEPWIPQGAITWLAGRDKTGKSTFVLGLIADLMENHLKTGLVHLCMAEDDLESVTLPRMLANGLSKANLKRIVHRDKGPWRFPKDLDEFATFLLTRDIKVVVLDSADLIIDGISSLRGYDTLDRLMRIAQQSNVALIIVGHVNTSAKPKSIREGIGGSRRVFAAARSILVWGTEPSLAGILGTHSWADEDNQPDPSGETFVLSQAAVSYGSVATSMLYERTFVPHPIKGNKDEVLYVPLAPVTYSAFEVLSGEYWSGGGSSGGGQKRKTAKNLILQFLKIADPERGLSADDLEEHVMAAQISRDSFQRARKELHADSFIETFQDKDAFGSMHHRWRLVTMNIPDTLPPDTEEDK